MVKLIDAIIAINPNAQVSILENDYNQITWHNIEAIDKATLDAKVSELETAQATAKAQKEADALAGNNKLLELGLTQAQVTAMTGYTPPANN